MTERGDSRIRFASRSSFSDGVILVLSLSLLTPWLVPGGADEMAAALAYLVGLPLLSGIAWFTALRDVRGKPMPVPTAAFVAFGLSVVFFFLGILVGPFALLAALVGVAMGLGTVRGLSLVRGLAAVTLIILSVVAVATGF